MPRSRVAPLSFVGLASVTALGLTFCNVAIKPTLDALAEAGVKASIEFEMHLERFDTKTNQFETLAPPPAKRNLFTVVSGAGKIIVVGGLNDDGNYVSTVEVYDPAAKAWKTGAPWPHPHLAYHAAVGDTICFFGGSAGSDAHISRDNDCYDAATDAWSGKASVPDDAGGGLWPTVFEGKVYLLGGTKFDNKSLVTPLATAYTFDPAANRWAAVAPPPESRGGSAVVTAGDRLYVVAGIGKEGDKGGPYAGDMLVYDPRADTWARGPQMPGRGIGFGVDVLANGPSAFFGAMPPALHHYDAAQSKWIAGKEPARDFDLGVYTYVVHGGNLYLLVLVDKIKSGSTQSSGKMWKYDPAKDEWAIVGSRSPDNRDAAFEGAPLGDSIYFAGAFTKVSITQTQPPAGDARAD